MDMPVDIIGDESLKKIRNPNSLRQRVLDDIDRIVVAGINRDDITEWIHGASGGNFLGMCPRRRKES